MPLANREKLIRYTHHLVVRSRSISGNPPGVHIQRRERPVGHSPVTARYPNEPRNAANTNRVGSASAS